MTFPVLSFDELDEQKTELLQRPPVISPAEVSSDSVMRSVTILIEIEWREPLVPKMPPAEDAAIEALFDRLAQMPVLDSRSPDEIIGYGPDGIPH